MLALVQSLTLTPTAELLMGATAEVKIGGGGIIT
jgi:hypothetical protein